VRTRLYRLVSAGLQAMVSLHVLYVLYNSNDTNCSVCLPFLTRHQVCSCHVLFQYSLLCSLGLPPKLKIRET
jgi:hypothetical protein